MLKNIGAKFLGRTIYLWGGEARMPRPTPSLPAQFRRKHTAAVLAHSNLPTKTQPNITGNSGHSRVYDSKGEAGLAQEIELLRRAGEGVKVEPQKTFSLHGKNGGRVCTHRVDFLLTFKDTHQEVWEYKGLATAIWRIKLKLFEDNYPEIIYNVITPRNRYSYGSKTSVRNR